MENLPESISGMFILDNVFRLSIELLAAFMGRPAGNGGNLANDMLLKLTLWCGRFDPNRKLDDVASEHPQHRALVYTCIFRIGMSTYSIPMGSQDTLTGEVTAKAALLYRRLEDMHDIMQSEMGLTSSLDIHRDSEQDDPYADLWDYTRALIVLTSALGVPSLESASDTEQPPVAS
ncbi:hypothetical protein SUNI508_12193 [Seiridium unicorne]|uniref:Uncharacterized protein n=1 Tax=Seiridium unicorne TaxID=138068 RepID=A0ABR2UEG5_9PEZI